MAIMPMVFISLVTLLWIEAIYGKSFQSPAEEPPTWHIHVTLHVFSGRPDPSWRIKEYHPAYNVILQNMGSIPSNPVPNRLGYKGFSLIHVAPGNLFNAGGALNQTVTSFPELELYLLNTADGVEIGVTQHAKQVILNQPKNADINSLRKRRSLDVLRYENQWPNLYPAGKSGKYDADFMKYMDEIQTTTQDPLLGLSKANIAKLAKALGLNDIYPNISTTPIPLGPTRYEPEKWNRNKLLMESNNCYNYANNEQTDTMAQPGKASDCEFSITHPKGTSIRKSAECDGLKSLKAPITDILPTHDLNLVALVFWPPSFVDDTWDFHWYRLDNNNMWSHKPGQTPATNLDQNHRPINDPRHAARGPYTEFVGFMETSPDRVKII